MDFHDPRTLLWLATGIYGVTFLAGLVSTARSKNQVVSIAPLILILSGFLSQTRGLYLRGLEVHGCPLGNSLERIQFILWSIVLAYLIMRILFRLNLLGSFSAGLACAGGALSLLTPNMDPPYWREPGYERLFADPWIELHASVAIFSYGLFALLAVVSFMYLTQQRALSLKRPGRLGPHLPSIHQLETGGERLLLAGVVFLTVSIAVGSLHWTRAPENVSGTKLAVTIALWIAYCMLWLLHFRQRLYGEKFAKACILLFCLAVLSLGLVSSNKEKTPPLEGQPASHAS